MRNSDFEAVMAGLNSLQRGVESYGDSRMKTAMLKRQIARDAQADSEAKIEQQMRNKQIELSAQAGNRDAARLVEEQGKNAAAEVQRQVENQRAEKEVAARIALTNAQTDAVKAKPLSPLSAQVDGLDDYGTELSAALEENNAALAAQQAAAASGDKTQQAAASQRVLKAQVKLSGLSQIAQGWQKGVQKEPTVDLEFGGEDGASKMRMKVPQSQWNPSHPMWGKFMSGDAGGATTATATSAPPAAAVDMLRKNPALAAEFDKKYGAGQAQRILGAK